ncbi:class I SAM-dependent methyltransferase [Luteimonas sp. FXH3W]|uniref:Class I SAM-dependent methyltransferase n=1 Tax=Aquilutibacter rugosus TaxID=3115820 RepID=A0ABU7UZA1_9GAMM
MSKVYDETYFNRWYRGAQPAADRAHLRRKVAMAVAMAEYYLERPIRTLLDIGAGEAAWRAPLLALRPKLQYLAFDSSEYAVQRYGARRQLHYATFGDFEWLRPCPPVDLLICADVMHYVPTAELKRGAQGLAALTGGLAFLETFVSGDPFAGDTDGFQKRSPAAFRKILESAGLAPIGSHFWARQEVVAQFAAMERPGG